MANTAYPGEQAVKDIIEEELGLQCDVGLGSPHRSQFSASAGNPHGEIEIDFLVPFGKTCIVGEHTAERDRKGVKRHLTKLSQKVEFLESINSEARFTPFQIPPSRRNAYRSVERMVGCLVYPHESHNREVKSDYPNVVSLSLHAWELVTHYAKCLGSYGKFHFLDSLGLSSKELAMASSPEVLSALRLTKGEYLHLGRRTISQGFPEADVFVFPLQPASLLPISRVLRRDSLPALFDPVNPDRNPKYQRVLIKKKLTDLRRLIKSVGASFAFPTALLALCSGGCHIDPTNGELLLPAEFGSLEIIDGQHRLFAYATSELSESIKKDSRLVVIAVKFADEVGDDAQAWAARMFIDINTKQTRVRRDLQMIIKYELGEQSSEALAAGVLLKLNDSGPLENMLNVGATSPRESIQINTIVSRLKTLCDLKSLRRLEKAAKRRRLKLLNGNTQILDAGMESEFVDAMATSLRWFTVRLQQTFEADWNAPEDSALLSAKYLAAFFGCLGNLMSAGKTRQQVDAWLARVRQRSLRVSTKEYQDRGIAFGSPNVPSRKSSVKEIADHLTKCGSKRNLLVNG